MVFVYVSILFGFLTVSAHKSDTFPPMEKVRKHYDIDYYVKTCYERTGADWNELHEFEITTDLEHVPNSHSIKLFFRCFGEVSESVDTKSNKLNFSKFLDHWADLTQAEQEIYLKMGKGCIRRAKSITDRLEFSYSITLCAKQNDNEHFHLFY
ncbi:uncharacterized protein LOC119076162 [Bradysia coprophila]|uniref:uncharacterized protein LOC119076162 n=1 Tax=Bradysia coprophila TaxID=38358 RepID=UPI00187D86F3|nr:uncharacterized protein LOC119076162 [Bradysia coprophila]